MKEEYQIIRFLNQMRNHKNNINIPRLQQDLQVQIEILEWVLSDDETIHGSIGYHS